MSPPNIVFHAILVVHFVIYYLKILCNRVFLKYWENKLTILTSNKMTHLSYQLEATLIIEISLLGWAQ